MEDFVDRLAALLKGLLGRGGGESPGQAAGKPRFVDPDVSQAWEELDEYMRTGRDPPRQETRGGAGTGRDRRSGERARRHAPDEDLRQDYANLEVPFGADIETVRRAYKTLIMRYHPDKHSGDPEKLRIATEITMKINESFDRIRSRTERS
jgi:DnaJ-domain-containing protein 1